MAYASSEDRSNLIAGLRALADFLEGNPQVPVPRQVDMLVFPSVSTDGKMRAEIDDIAKLIGVEIHDQTAEYGHYAVARKFGPVEYRALAILARARASHDALMSYSKNVIPDSAEGV